MEILAAITLLNQLIAQSMALGKLIQTARSENRDITPEEIDSLAGVDDSARSALLEAIERAKSEGR